MTKDKTEFVEKICPVTDEPCPTPLLCRLFGEFARCDEEHVRQKEEEKDVCQ